MISLQELTLILSEEIKDARDMLQRSDLSRHHHKLEMYRKECESFLAAVRDEKSFDRWYAREHWETNARWFSLVVANDGTLPASGVHARLTGTPWLRFYDDEPKFEGPLLPRRPDFYPPIHDDIGLFRASLPDLTARFDASRFVFAGGPVVEVIDGVVDLHIRGVDHRHRSAPLGEIVTLAGPVPPGVYSVQYETFHTEDIDWRKRDLLVRIVPSERRYGYKYPLREAALEVVVTKL